MYHSTFITDIKIVGINIYTCSTQVGKEWQSLVYFSGYMEEYVFRDASVIGVEILITPLVFRITRFFPVFPVIVGTHRHYIINFTRLYQAGNIKTKAVSRRFHAILHGHHLHTHLPLAAHLQIQEILFALCSTAGIVKCLPVPGNACSQVNDIFFKSIVFIPGTGQGNVFPGSIVIAAGFRSGNVTYVQFPAGIEIVFHPLR